MPPPVYGISRERKGRRGRGREEAKPLKIEGARVHKHGEKTDPEKESPPGWGFFVLGRGWCGKLMNKLLPAQVENWGSVSKRAAPEKFRPPPCWAGGVVRSMR